MPSVRLLWCLSAKSSCRGSGAHSAHANCCVFWLQLLELYMFVSWHICIYLGMCVCVSVCLYPNLVCVCLLYVYLVCVTGGTKWDLKNVYACPAHALTAKQTNAYPNINIYAQTYMPRLEHIQFQELKTESAAIYTCIDKQFACALTAKVRHNMRQFYYTGKLFACTLSRTHVSPKTKNWQIKVPRNENPFCSN
jgi:hypothetical protein